ncbi:hypothetical protein NLR40_24325, partial [Escherichia coli]|nr:hypothetical protein [Escherichia coli]
SPGASDGTPAVNGLSALHATSGTSGFSFFVRRGRVVVLAVGWLALAGAFAGTLFARKRDGGRPR